MRRVLLLGLVLLTGCHGHQSRGVFIRIEGPHGAWRISAGELCQDAEGRQSVTVQLDKAELEELGTKP